MWCPRPCRSVRRVDSLSWNLLDSFLDQNQILQDNLKINSSFIASWELAMFIKSQTPKNTASKISVRRKQWRKQNVEFKISSPKRSRFALFHQKLKKTLKFLNGDEFNSSISSKDCVHAAEACLVKIYVSIAPNPTAPEKKINASTFPILEQWNCIFKLVLFCSEQRWSAYKPRPLPLWCLASRQSRLSLISTSAWFFG